MLFSYWNIIEEKYIIGSTSGDQTDYQIKFIVYYDSIVNHNDIQNNMIFCDESCRTDFGDIRFTNEDNVPLSYWIEKQVDSSYAVFWVKVDTILAAPELKKINIYYGKEDATSLSNGDDTFLFFDDFNGTSLDTNKWDVQYWANPDFGYGTASYTVADGAIVLSDAGAGSYRTIELWSKTFNAATSGMIIKADFQTLEQYNLCYSFGMVATKSITGYDRENGKLSYPGYVWTVDELDYHWFKLRSNSDIGYATTIGLTDYTYYSKFISGSIVYWGETTANTNYFNSATTDEVTSENMYISLLSGCISGENTNANVMTIYYIAIRKVVEDEPSVVGYEPERKSLNYKLIVGNL